MSCITPSPARDAGVVNELLADVARAFPNMRMDVDDHSTPYLS